MSLIMVYKNCSVPQCKSSTSKTPGKLFFQVPKGPLREKWCTIVRRDNFKSSSSAAFCCEDHFDIENDVENWLRYKILKDAGKPTFTLRLKKGIMPHKFDCQTDRGLTHSKNARSVVRKAHLSMLESILNDEDETSAENIPTVIEDFQNMIIGEESVEVCEIGSETEIIARIEKAFQVQLSVVSVLKEMSDETKPTRGLTIVKQEELLHPDEADGLTLLKQEPYVKNEELHVSYEAGGLIHLKQEPYVKQEEELHVPDEGGINHVKEELPFQDEDELIDEKQEELLLPDEADGLTYLKQELYVKQEEELHVLDECAKRRYHRHGETIQCTQFNQESVQSGIMKKHSIVCPTNEQFHHCLHCEYKSVQRVNLKNHIMTRHSKERPHQCPCCDYKSITIPTLKNHIMFCHTGEKPFQCPHCDYKAVISGRLRKHIMSRHSKEKPHHCPHCDYKSVESRDLKKHIMTLHTGQKHCSQCFYKSVSSKDLKLHIMIHHKGKKLYQCPLCEYKSVYKHNLKKHIIAHHTSSPMTAL